MAWGVQWGGYLEGKSTPDVMRSSSACGGIAEVFLASYSTETGGKKTAVDHVEGWGKRESQVQASWM